MRRRDGEIEFDAPQFRGRARLLAGLLALTALVLVGRSMQLQVLDHEFIEKQADMRHARTAKLEAHRGAIVDRFGEPLAVSSPVDTVWVNPPEFAEAGDGIVRLARALKLNRQWLGQRVTSNLDRDFLYVARHLEPDDGGEDPQAGDSRRLLHARVQALLPERRGHGPPARLHQPRRGGTRGARVRLQPLALRHRRREARDPERPRPGDPERRGAEGAAAGRGPRHQHRPAHPVPGLPRAQGRDARAQRQGGHRGRARHRDRRGARDGQPAVVQPERPHAVRGLPLPQPRGDRHLRAGLEHQAVRRRRGARVRALRREQQHRRHPVQGRLAADPRPPRPRHDRHGRGARAIEQRRDGEDRALARQVADARHAAGPRLRQGDGERLSGRVRGTPLEHRELEADQHRDHGLWLRPVGHAAAARPGLRDGRRLRPAPAGHLPAHRGRPGGRARDAGPRRPRPDRPARGGRDAGRHRHQGRGGRLSRRRQDRHRVEGDSRRLFAGPLPLGVRRRGAGERAAARRRRHGRRAGGRPSTTAATSRRRCSRR